MRLKVDQEAQTELVEQTILSLLKKPSETSLVAGSLSRSVQYWKEICLDPVVLTWIHQGLNINLYKSPLRHIEKQQYFPPSRKTIIDKQVRE